MKGLVLVFITFVIYFIPTIVALQRKHGSSLAIVMVNALFGWTFIGWIWALIWSLARK